MTRRQAERRVRRFENVGSAKLQLVRDLKEFVKRWPEEDRRCDALSGTLHFLADLVEVGMPLGVPHESLLRAHAETLKAKQGYVEDDDES